MKSFILLALFFFAQASIADIKIRAVDKYGRASCGDGCIFKTQEEADSWKNKQITNDSWGKKDRWLRFQGEPDPGYTDTREVEVTRLGSEPEIITEYFYPQEYTITETDVTAEMNAKRNKRAEDALMMQSIREKLSNKAPLTITDILNYIRIKEGL